MFRIILFIIFAILEIFFNNNRSYRYRTYRFSSDGRDRIIEEISKFFRRQRALKTCKYFLKKSKNAYNIKNQYISIIYGTKAKTIKCYNTKNRKETTTISLEEEAYSANSQYEDLFNFFEEKFNEICNNFNSQTTYEEVSQDLILTFQSTKVTRAPIVEHKEKEDTNGIMPEVKPMLDINSATEEEITDLPGINVVLAKKIIQYRELNNGFKNLDEFYKKMKIKSHFIEKLDEMICVKDYIVIDKPKKQNERVLDF